MSATERIEGLDCLFADPSRKLVNIKFFRGGDVEISPARFKQELCASIDRRRADASLLSRQPPATRKAPVDLKAFVADM